jgi:superoxide dismutase, Fe-Mn family
MPIYLQALPYADDALQPHISSQTVRIHHQKHQKKYVTELNRLIRDTPFEHLPLIEIVKHSFNVDEKVFENAAQAWNHAFYWQCMTPKMKRPTVRMLKIIEQSFGSFADFEAEFEEAALKLFGSGWNWLAKTKSGLIIEPLSNADNPLVFKEQPLLVCDVWEHAYYLDFQSDRKKYIKSFLKLVDWSFVERNFFETDDKAKTAVAVGSNQVISISI